MIGHDSCITFYHKVVDAPAERGKRTDKTDLSDSGFPADDDQRLRNVGDDRQKTEDTVAVEQDAENDRRRNKQISQTEFLLQLL